MGAGNDYNITSGSPTAKVEGATKGKVFRANANDFDRVARSNGDCGIGGARIDYNNFAIGQGLLHDAAE